MEAELVARRRDEHRAARGGVARGAVERGRVGVGAEAHAHHPRATIGRIDDRLRQAARLVQDVVRGADRQDRGAGGDARNAGAVVRGGAQHSGHIRPVGVAGVRADVGVPREEVVAAPVVHVAVAVVVHAVGAPVASAAVGAGLAGVGEPAPGEVGVVEVHAHVDVGDRDAGPGGERPCAIGRDAAVEPARGAGEVPLLVGGVGQRAGVEQRVVRRCGGEGGGRLRGSRERAHRQRGDQRAEHQRRPGSTSRAPSIVATAGKLSRRR